VRGPRSTSTTPAAVKRDANAKGGDAEYGHVREEVNEPHGSNDREAGEGNVRRRLGSGNRKAVDAAHALIPLKEKRHRCPANKLPAALQPLSPAPILHGRIASRTRRTASGTAMKIANQ